MQRLHLFLEAWRLLVCCIILSLVSAQTSTNPAVWQEPQLYNITEGNDKGSAVNVESRVAISQDFQVLYSGDDGKQPTSRIAFDFSFSCHSTNTTFDTVQQLNNHSIILPPVRTAPKIALVQRGYCNWSEKLAVVAALSAERNLYVGAVMIYDNDSNTGQATYHLQPATGQTSAPTYSSPLPGNRTVASMPDNDVKTNELTYPVYFAPNAYGKQLVRLLTSTANTTGDLRQYWQLTAFLGTVDWNENDDQGSFLNALASSRGYLSYIIVLVAIFLIGVIFLRWWRLRRIRREMDNEAALHGTAYMLQERTRRMDPLPADVLNAIPICLYTPNAAKNTSCAICLDDFVENKTEIRTLPCGHGFCVLCIDPWLTQKSSVCPICKWDCLPPERREQESSEQAMSSGGSEPSLARATSPQQRSHTEDPPVTAPLPSQAGPASSTTAQTSPRALRSPSPPPSPSHTNRTT